VRASCCVCALLWLSWLGNMHGVLPMFVFLFTVLLLLAYNTSSKHV
jgi:hypothetical protein